MIFKLLNSPTDFAADFSKRKLLTKSHKMAFAEM